MGNISKKKLIITVLILLAVLAVSTVLLITGAAQEAFMAIGIYTEPERNIEVKNLEYVSKGSARLCSLEDRFLIADQTGVSCYSSDGVWMWSKELSLSSPGFIEADEKILVADIGGNGIHCFDKNGFLWTYLEKSTITGISNNCVKSKFAVIHQSEGYISAVTIVDFEEEAKALATIRFGQDYIQGASVKPDGKEIVLTGIEDSEGDYKSICVTIDAETASEKQSDKDISDKWMPLVYTPKQDTAILAGGENIIILKNSRKTKEIEKDFDAVCLEDDSRFVALSDTDEDVRVITYDFTGDEMRSFPVKSDAKFIRTFENTIALVCENEILFYNRYGHYLGTADSISQITDAVFSGERKMLVCGGSGTAEITLK